MTFLQQVWTLTLKNLLVVLVRPWVTTPLRALVLPIAFAAFITYAREIFVAQSNYGIGPRGPILSLPSALHQVGGGRTKLVFVNNGHTGGYIEAVIDRVAGQARGAGTVVEVLTRPTELGDVCRSSIRGSSACIAAAVFSASPSEGPGGKWNYTIRADSSLGPKLDMTKLDNAEQIYTLPLQHAIDWAIADVTNGSTAYLPESVMQYPFTDKTQAQRQDQLKSSYDGTITSTMGVAFFIIIIGVAYQLTGLIATERELGMSQLIDCMLPGRSRFGAQAARMLAAHFALDMVYSPAWIVSACIMQVGVFSNTNFGILIGFHLLAGLSLSSFSIFGASFFKRAQLSGIFVVIVSLVLGIIAQKAPITSNGAVIILSLLFPPMTYVYFIILVAHWQRQELGVSLTQASPNNLWTVSGIVFWVLLIIQIMLYPILAIYVERLLFATRSEGRMLTRKDDPSVPALSLRKLTKQFHPNWFNRQLSALLNRRSDNVMAVEGLSLDINRGQIMVLLGANGSGKSTTLYAISGLSDVTSGEINVNLLANEGGFGLCPQANVLWDSLTVEEHIRIFNCLKGETVRSDREEVNSLIKGCDLKEKSQFLSKNLSGGQKRKLQLAMMFTGRSSICCVDEVSSGLDPISRRKIWDILLAGRGERTILLTTHFLDEADLLADQIAILSKGSLKAKGTSVELKHKLGSGYRVQVYHMPVSEKKLIPHFDDLRSEICDDSTLYFAPSSSQAANLVTHLEEAGIEEYRVSGPTIEDVFLNVAAEAPEPLPVAESDGNINNVAVDGSNYRTPKLSNGQRISTFQQVKFLFMKRCKIFRRSWFPYLIAFLCPVVTAGLVTLFFQNYQKLVCAGPNTLSSVKMTSLNTSFKMVLGPSHRFSSDDLDSIAANLAWASGKNTSQNVTGIRHNISTVDTLDQFNNFVTSNFSELAPGGFFIGDNSAPTVYAWRANGGGMAFSTLIQGLADSVMTGNKINLQYMPLDTPWTPGYSKALQLSVYFILAMLAYPGFFSLYPTLERIRHIRALEYSNGVRSLPLWLAYLLFDFIFVLVSSALVIIIWAASSDVWYHLPYLFLIFILYGIGSTEISYIVSLKAKSQLAAYAFSVGGHAVIFLIYLVAYVAIITYAQTNQIDHDLLISHFVVSAFAPVGSIVRAMFTTLNLFSILCRGKQTATYPAAITLYGGPILYLIVQCLFLFGVLLWWDCGHPIPTLHRSKPLQYDEEMESEIHLAGPEEKRLSKSNDGLRVLHLSKRFGDFVAVDDVSFGVSRGEVFALLGPNGAGKSTTINLIRGDILPSDQTGEIYIQNVSIPRQRPAARSHLGVCPQFDAMDQLTVFEQLRFYAQIRGVQNVSQDIYEVLVAVGLLPYSTRLASKLSGGNKRKLSLAIALLGNPAVLLLDEPSSGMDAAAKRVMWRTLAALAPDRALLLTTHSMEEADALADRAGILARRMLATGDSESLRREYGHAYYVHCVHSQAPHTPSSAMLELRKWVLDTFPGTQVEAKTYHGQLRFTVPAAISQATATQVTKAESAPSEFSSSTTLEKDVGSSVAKITPETTIGELFSQLERNKVRLGVEYYSISQATLDQVFLSIVGQHFISDD